MRRPAEHAVFEPAWNYVAQTGESPTWSDSEQALYWIDIQQPALHRLDPLQGKHRQWEMPNDIGCFALHSDGEHVLVALRSGVFKMHLRSGSLWQLVPSPFDPALYRFNEGRCDCFGRFWMGTMFDPKPPNPSPHVRQRQPWHCYEERTGLIAHDDWAVIPNGLAWNPTYEIMYVAHSNDRIIYAYDYDAAHGTLGARRIFATIPAELGVPDGGAVDVEGCYWCALAGGHRLRRFRADGSWDFDLPLPVSRPTMCAFGDSDRGTLYVTSASSGLSQAEAAREPYAGQLLRCRIGIRGLPTARFGAAAVPAASSSYV